MPLRVRLTVAFLAMVTLPLVVAVVVVLRNVGSQLDRETKAPLPNAASSVDAVLEQLEQQAQAALNELGRAPNVRERLPLDREITPVETAHLSETLRKYAVGEDGTNGSPLLIDFVAITDAQGKALASAERRQPHFRGTASPALTEILAKTALTPPQQAGPFTVYAVSDLVDAKAPTRVIARFVAGYWVDDITLRRELAAQQLAVTLISGTSVLSSTSDDVGLVADLADEPATAIGRRVGDGFYTRQPSKVNGVDIVVAVPRRNPTQERGEIFSSLLPVILISVLLAAVLGWFVARFTTRPLEELSEAARRVARGELSTTIQIRSGDEVGRVATAFNTMTGELRAYVDALHASRDELQDSLTRLGDTLSSTHDLKRMLAVVLETAMLTSSAEAGALMLFSRTREELYLKVGRGLDGRVSASAVRVKVGAGVAGRVARTGEPLAGRVGSGPDGLELAPTEPTAHSVVSVPLRSAERIIGVLSLYDRRDGTEFTDEDVQTIRSFANQASTAIDNVLLHQEAQRLSITDGMTGLWNFRYFQMKLAEELERAVRFERTLTLLLLDLDHFKKVNDEHGHQRGDAVLIELATRLKTTIREVDVLARYGGEEFVLLLPETDLEGAERTAVRIGEVVRNRPFGAPDEVPLPITVSIGVAVHPVHAGDANSLVSVADAALYEAKRDGRNCYKLAAPAPGVKSGRKSK